MANNDPHTFWKVCTCGGKASGAVSHYIGDIDRGWRYSIVFVKKDLCKTEKRLKCGIQQWLPIGSIFRFSPDTRFAFLSRRSDESCRFRCGGIMNCAICSSGIYAFPWWAFLRFCLSHFVSPNYPPRNSALFYAPHQHRRSKLLGTCVNKVFLWKLGTEWNFVNAIIILFLCNKIIQRYWNCNDWGCRYRRFKTIMIDRQNVNN